MDELCQAMEQEARELHEKNKRVSRLEANDYENPKKCDRF